MAAASLKHGIVWLPARKIGERALVNEPRLRVLAPGAERQGGERLLCSLEALPPMRSVVLVFDPRDVSLLPVKLPPMSAARLAKALPNMLEEHLLQDASACAFVAGPTAGEGERLVAVVDRAWLDFVVGAFERRGIKVQAAWPAQLCLPLREDAWSLMCTEESLALRTGAVSSITWSAGEDLKQRQEAVASLLEAARSVGARASQSTRDASVAGGSSPAGSSFPVTALHVLTDDPNWREVFSLRDAPVGGLRPELTRVGVDPQCPIDLLAGRQSGAFSRWRASVDWRQWRPALVFSLAAAVLMVGGLNLHWARMLGERSDLRAQMVEQFRAAFPQAQVVVDPLLQMQRQTAELRQRAGQSAPSDFLPLYARLARALGADGVDALSSVEYRDNRLKLRWRNSPVDPALRERLQALCRQQGLQLSFEGDAVASLSLAAQR